ncbi:MAG: histidine kinase [Nocardioides sp.]
MTWPRRLAWAAALLVLAAAVACAVMTALHPSTTAALLVAVVVVLGGVPCAAGLWVSARQAGNALAPALALPGLLVAGVLTLVVGSLTLPADLPGGDYVTVASQGAWVLLYVVLAVPLLLFPDGHLASRASRWLLVAILVDAAVFMVVAATAPGPFLAPDQDVPHVFGTMPGVLADVLVAVTLPALPLTLVGLVLLLRSRYRGSPAAHRRQLRWLALGATLLPITVLAVWASYAVVGNGDVVLAAFLVISFLGLPVLMAVGAVYPEAVDVDRALAGTASHAVATAGLLTVFTAANLAAGLLVGGSAPTVAVAVTALVAIALSPARRRLQGLVDRRLYPARRAAFAAIDALHAETLSSQATPEEVEQRLRDALHDQHLVIGFRTPRSGNLVDGNGRALDPDLLPDCTDITLGGEVIGLLSVGAPLSSELARDIAQRAAPLVELARLRTELRAALLEVEESRTRLLRVGYEERTRLERDLHDGAQQRLVALGMALRLAQRRTARGIEVSGVIDNAVAELSTAVSELRQLAHGIRPSCLDDGLVPALSQLVGSTPTPIDLRVTSVPLDPDLETTAYYVAAEAITNAIKHAEARRITLEVDVVDRRLHVRVTDDGTGRATVRRGSGLAGLADRVGAHGGRLTVDSNLGRGTVIEAVLPCAS